MKNISAADAAFLLANMHDKGELIVTQNNETHIKYTNEDETMCAELFIIIKYSENNNFIESEYAFTYVNMRDNTICCCATDINYTDEDDDSLNLLYNCTYTY